MELSSLPGSHPKPGEGNGISPAPTLPGPHPEVGAQTEREHERPQRGNQESHPAPEKSPLHTQVKKTNENLNRLNESLRQRAQKKILAFQEAPAEATSNTNRRKRTRSTSATEVEEAGPSSTSSALSSRHHRQSGRNRSPPRTRRESPPPPSGAGMEGGAMAAMSGFFELLQKSIQYNIANRPPWTPPPPPLPTSLQTHPKGSQQPTNDTAGRTEEMPSEDEDDDDDNDRILDK